MEHDFKVSVFYKAVMTAVFVGIITTLFTMVYDVAFVKKFNFPLSDIINAATLIFFVNLLFLVIGCIYYWFIVTFKKGDIFFIVLFIGLTVFFAWKAGKVYRTSDPYLNTEFHQLLTAITLIIGLLAALAIPFLYHNRQFKKYVL